MLSGIYAAIAEDLGAQFAVGYTPSASGRRGSTAGSPSR